MVSPVWPVDEGRGLGSYALRGDKLAVSNATWTEHRATAEPKAAMRPFGAERKVPTGTLAEDEAFCFTLPDPWGLQSHYLAVPTDVVR